MTDIDVPDWVVDQFATIIFDTQGLDWPEDFPECADDVRAQIRAALSAWVVPAGFTNSEEMRELLAGRGGWVSGIELDGDTHTLYTLRQEKPE